MKYLVEYTVSGHGRLIVEAEDEDHVQELLGSEVPTELLSFGVSADRVKKVTAERAFRLTDIESVQEWKPAEEPE
jgi:DNA polymerase III psi subunit